MNRIRKGIEHDIINYQYFFGTIIIWILLLSSQIYLLWNTSIWVITPIILLSAFFTWEFSNSLLFQIKLLLTKTDESPSEEFNDVLEAYPDVAFILPSYHEPFEVAKMTFDSILDLEYPGTKEIIVVDNSRNVDTSDFKEWKAYVNSFVDQGDSLEVQFIYNSRQEGLKPGNLDLAQEHIQSEYVVFLDIDSTLPRIGNILQRSIAEFSKDESLGWIQFVAKPTNYLFNVCSRAISTYQNLLRRTCFFKSKGGFTLFYGHNAIWRTSCLKELGPWFEKHNGQIMVTEDILKCIRAYGKGYYGKGIPTNTGEWVPTSLSALESMWQRWTFGSCQVAGKYLKSILGTKEMTILEKYDLVYHIALYWRYALLFPLMLLFTMLLPAELCFLFILVLFVVPQVLNVITMYKDPMCDRPQNPLQKFVDIYNGSFIISNYLALVQLKGIFNYLFKVEKGWVVTPKGGENASSWYNIVRSQSLYIVFAILLVGSAVFSIFSKVENPITGIVLYSPPLFLAFNLLLSVVIFGKSGRIVVSSIHDATIDALSNTEPITPSRSLRSSHNTVITTDQKGIGSAA